MKNVYTDKAPEPAGHYSQAVVKNGWVFVSGQLPVKAGTGEKIKGGIEEQAKQVLKNISEILKASGSGVENVVKTTVYITDINLWDSVNKVYGEFFKEHKPARVIVPTRELHYGFDIEMDVVAVVSKEG